MPPASSGVTKLVIGGVENLSKISTAKITKILLADSKEKSQGYWNSHSKLLSTVLFAPITSSVLVAKESTSSYVSIQSHPTQELFPISWKPTLDKEDEQIMVARKYRFFVNNSQKQLFHKYFGAHRFFYNLTVDYLNGLEEGVNAESFYTVRKRLIESAVPAWCSNIPYSLKESAIKLALTMHKSAITNFYQSGRKYEMKCLTLKDKDDQFHLKSEFIRNGHICKRALKKKSELSIQKNRRKEFLSLKPRDFTIQHSGRAWFIIMPQYRDKIEVRGEKKPIVALDPGVRTFQSYYSPEQHGKIGDGFTNRYKKIHERMDRLDEIIKQPCPSRKKYHIKRRLDKLRTKASNLTREMHMKTAAWLASQYSHIIIPTFSTQSIAMKSKNRIMNRAMYQLSHFSFRQRLQHQCNLRKSHMILASEAHTTMTCGKCGNRKRDVGAAKIYQCDECDYVADRDVSASRNILIRSLTKFMEVKHSRKGYCSNTV